MEPYKAAKEIVETLKKHGFNAYFAGGWVRDFLMKHPSSDIDIASSALPQDLQKIFPKTIPVGIQFGIVIVVHGGHHFEVATFRKDLEYKDGRRPERIEISNPIEDAKRRDFTINGLFYDPIEEEIFDYVDGKKDLEKGLIRCIGDPHERFTEDKLRIIRAVRYATRFGFAIDPTTLTAMKIHAGQIVGVVAMERIQQEFKKMHVHKKLPQSLTLLQDIGVLEHIFIKLKGFPPKEIAHRLSAEAHFPKETPMIAVILELFPNSSLEEKLDVCSTLKLSVEERSFVESLHKAEELSLMPTSWQESLELYDWTLFYADPKSYLCLEIVYARREIKERETFLDQHRERMLLLEMPIARQRTKNFLIRAEDLMSFGLKPNKILGDLLKEAERIAVNLQLTNKEAILELLQKTLLWQRAKNGETS